VFATFGLVSLPSHLLPLAQEAFAVVLLIGLAVGVDYSMFYLRREREERAAGRSERAALEAAAATSGRSVLISGLTVMVAMAGLFLTGDANFASFGYATMIVVAVAMLGSLTVLPAVLSKLGDRVDRLHVPLVGRLRRDNGEGRIWGAIVDRVLRRPLLSTVIAGGLLLALAAPALQLRMATPGPDTFPKSLDVVKTYNRMQHAFPGTALPAYVVVKARDVNAPAVRQAISRLETAARTTGRARGPITIVTNTDHTIANITIPILGKGTDAQSNASLAALREDVLPQTVGALPNVQSGVTGLTAEWKDAKDQLKSKLPLVVAFVLLLAFALMLVAFRSIVVAVKAILLNLLSVAAAYGVLVLVFQHGIGKGLLGFSSTAGIDPVTPLLLFVILFGLSMDYHVFIISRIRETFDRGASMDEAIAHGIKSTAGVVTSAAVVMVAVFSIFATLSMLIFKQFGVGLAAAILIDATLVRGVLLPATMKLLGERNWYLPSWLQWLPRFEAEEPTAAPEANPVPVSA
jgi:RND superfamily putative drug exporter